MNIDHRSDWEPQGLGLVPMGGLRFLLALLITWFLLAGLRDLIVP